MLRSSFTERVWPEQTDKWEWDFRKDDRFYCAVEFIRFLIVLCSKVIFFWDSRASWIHRFFWYSNDFAANLYPY